MKKYTVILLVGLVMALASCESIKSFSRSEFGRVAISSGGAYLVAEAVEKNPDLVPVLLAVADQQEGVPVDFSRFEKREVVLAVHTLGVLSDHYGDEASGKLLADSIRVGVGMAGSK